MIIMEFGGRATLAEAFANVEQCDRALCQHNATDLVSLLVDSSKSRKVLVAAARLAEAEVNKILYVGSVGMRATLRMNVLKSQCMLIMWVKKSKN